MHLKTSGSQETFFFLLKVMEHWHRLPRGGEIFRSCLGSWVALLELGLGRMDPGDPSHSDRSVVMSVSEAYA